jgi:type II secretory pathway pseudopilin PulG
MLVVVAIFGGLLGALTTSLTMNRTVHLSAEASIQVQQEARRALDLVVKELHQAGHVNGDASIATPVQRLDFQISRGYDAIACGGICWGTDDPSLPTGWVHYMVDTTLNRIVRCLTAGRLDAMPADYAGCRVLANHVNANVANTAFTYDHTARIVTIQLQTQMPSAQLPGGNIQVSPTSLVSRIPLRNTL